MIDKRISKSKKIARVKTDRARCLYFMIYPHLDRDGMVAFDDLDDLRVEILTYFFKYTALQVSEDLNELADAGLIEVFLHNEKIAIRFIRFNDFQTFNYGREAKSEITKVPDDSGALRITPDNSGALWILPPKIKIKSNEGMKEVEEAAPLPDLTPIEREILKELKTVKGYPYQCMDTIGYLRDLAVDFPRVDVLEEVKKKVAWWKDHPLKKNQSPHLQLRNWFKNAQKWAAEDDQTRQVGKQQQSSPQYTDKEKELMPQFEQEYEDQLEQAKKKYGWKTDDDIDPFKVPTKDEYIKSRLTEIRKQAKKGTTKCPTCRSIVLNGDSCQNCGEGL